MGFLVQSTVIEGADGGRCDNGSLMPHSDRLDIVTRLPPFDRFEGIRRLAEDRSGRGSAGHARHDLYAGRDSRTAANVLIKVTSKPGLVYQRNLANEIDSLTTINRELAVSPYFPVIIAHGRLSDGRVYLIMTLFDEFPLATVIGTEPAPARMVAHLRTAIEVARALAELHQLPIFHVDLNPMNILLPVGQGPARDQDCGLRVMVRGGTALERRLLRSADHT